MTYEVFIPLWVHVALPPVLVAILVIALVRAIWSGYRAHVNRRTVLRRLEALR